MGADICFAVARYSHATGLRTDNKVSWTHIDTPNLFIVVKGTGHSFKDEKLMLRIVQRNDVLESLDVGSYIDEAIRTRRSVQVAGPTLFTEQLPIFGITRDTIVALRYTLRNGEARRLQMQMHSSAECRQIVDTLQVRGMEFKEQRPNTAHANTARPLTTSSQVVPPYSNTRHFDAAEAPARHPFAPAVIEAGSLSQLRPTSPDRHTSPTELLQRQEHSIFEEMAPPRLHTRADDSLASQQLALARPSTSEVHRSNSIQPLRSHFDAHDIVHQALKSGFARPSSTSNTVGAEAISNEFDQTRETPSQHELVNATSLRLAPVSSDPASSLTFGRTIDTQSLPCGTSRPARPATSSSIIFPQTLEHEIPPRRELPFHRPDSQRSEAESSRPRSALTLPPLPKPRLSLQDPTPSNISDKPAAKRLSPARPQTSSPLKRSLADVRASEAATKRPNTASPAKRPSHPAIRTPPAPAKKPSRMEELLQERKMSLAKSAADKASRRDSLADAPGDEDEQYWSANPSRTTSPDRSDSMSPVKRSNADQDPTMSAHAAIRSVVRDTDSLKLYAEQSLEDRQTALDEFMVENIENPNFMVLCKDVENCWRRIALGL